MPSKSKRQARFMAACAHGAKYKSCPPKKVAREFNKADKKTGILRKEDWNFPILQSLLENDEWLESGVIRNIWMTNTNKNKLINIRNDISIIPVPNMPKFNNASCYNIFGDDLISLYDNQSIFSSRSKIYRLDEEDDRTLRINKKHPSWVYKPEVTKGFLSDINELLTNGLEDEDRNYRIGWARIDNFVVDKFTFSHFSNSSDHYVGKYIDFTIQNMFD